MKSKIIEIAVGEMPDGRSTVEVRSHQGLETAEVIEATFVTALHLTKDTVRTKATAQAILDLMVSMIMDIGPEITEAAEQREKTSGH